MSQISVYETDKVVTVEPSGTADVEPGLFFKYRISPFEHVIREDRKEFWSLVVRLCGVMGGMMAVGGKGRRECWVDREDGGWSALLYGESVNGKWLFV